MKKEVKRFADSKTIYIGKYPAKVQDYKHWIEYSDGTKEYVTSGRISSIWHDWCSHSSIDKYEEDGFTVYEYTDR